MRPLVVRFGAMGDMVILLALLRALHERFGEPVDVISSGSWTRPLLESQPGIGSLHVLRSRRTPYAVSLEQQRLVRTLRARGPRPVWICDADEKCPWLIARAGIPDSYVVRADEYPCREGEHAVDRWWRFAHATPRALATMSVHSAESALPVHVPPLIVAQSWREDVARWLGRQGLEGRKLILIQAGNRRITKWGRPRKRATNLKYWPEERWAQVIDAVAEREPDAEILLLGVPLEAPLNEAILAHTRTARARNVARELPLQRLLALQERASGMISVDTGPAHSAAALGCPLVAMFSQAEPSFYAPRSPTSAVTCLRRWEAGQPYTLLTIPAAEVIEAWDKLRAAREEHDNRPPDQRYAGGYRVSGER